MGSAPYFRTPARSFAEMRVRLTMYVTIDSLTGCWNWKNKPKNWKWKSGGRNYPYVNFEGKYQKASRIVFLVFKNFRLGKLCALHSCDNTWCICPDHLYKGTQGRNLRDCVERGRHHWANKIRCPRGHLLSKVNGNRRRCLECHKVASRNWWRRKIQTEKGNKGEKKEQVS
jgi:hypothetical protein